MDTVLPESNKPVEPENIVIVEVKGEVSKVTKDSGFESSKDASDASKGLTCFPIIPFQALNNCIEDIKNAEEVVLQSSVIDDTKISKENNWSTIQGSANVDRGQ